MVTRNMYSEYPLRILNYFNWQVPETPRRKRGAGTDKEYGHRGVGESIGEVPETPGEAIVKRLTSERIQVK